MAAEWSSSQGGSELSRLPSGGNDGELSVEQQQQQQQHLKGGGGAEIHGSSSSFEEWYDVSLMDEMKELSSFRQHQQQQQQQQHQNQQQQHIRNSTFDRRFSTFLDVDESSFMGDFAAAAAAAAGHGLLPPPPPLLPPPPPPLLPPPPPPPPRHHIGLLDLGGGAAAAATAAAAWASPSFGIATSLSIGTMSGGGSIFSSKANQQLQQQQQQHTGSGHSSPSTIIKSPTSALDSSLEIAGGGGDEAAAAAAAVAATTGRQRRRKSGGGSSSSPPAAGEEAALDARDDEDMDDASGLLCDNDELTGQPAPSTGQPGGKGNRKGLPAKNLMAERRRRKKLNDRLYMLRSVVPRITKMDRASILGDAIEYLKELLQRINELHNELEGPADPGPLAPSDQHIPALPGMIPAPPPLLMPPACVKEECGGSSAGPPPPPPSASEPPKVDVRTRDGKTMNIHMFCARRPGLLLSTMRALDGLGLDVQQAVISCFNGFVLDVFRAEQCREGEVAPEDIKSALLQTAGCNNEAISS